LRRRGRAGARGLPPPVRLRAPLAGCLGGTPGFAPESRQVTGARRFSQAISEGDGISIVVPVGDPGTARAAEEQGAEALALHDAVDSVREATSLPLLWRPHGSPDRARAADVDACVPTGAELDGGGGELERAYRTVLDLGLECAVE